MKNSCLNIALHELSRRRTRCATRARRQSQAIAVEWTKWARFYNVSFGAPSDGRAIANTRADVRRMLHEDGMLIDSASQRCRGRSIHEPSMEQRVAALELELAAMRNDRGNRNRRDEKGVNTHG